MAKTWPKVAVALFLLVLLLGGTAAISITVGVIVFAIIGLILLTVLLFSVIRPRLNHNRKQRAQKDFLKLLTQVQQLDSLLQITPVLSFFAYF